MNSLIVYPLIILLFAGAFCQLANLSSIDLTYTGTQNNSVSGSQTVNSSTSSYASDTSGNFAVSMTTGLIILIVSLIVVGAVAGIQVLGSGLSPFSVQLIYKGVVYYGLWGMFSYLSSDGWFSIPYFGAFAWLALTVVYTLGFFQTMNIGAS